jgi:hypothetical protein
VAQPVATVPGVARKYPTLSKTFFNGSPQGQILSVYKTRSSNPQKVADFKAALENGDCTLGDTPFSKAVVEKAAALGIEVPENLVVGSKTSRIPEFVNSQSLSGEDPA